MSVQWEFSGYTTYEERYPGLGSSKKYRSSIGWVDVYSYSLKRADWAGGSSDPAFAAHFQTTVDDVQQLALSGDYSELEMGPVQDVEIAGQPFRTVTFKLASKGLRLQSMTFVTALQGRLLKYRMSFVAPVPADVQDIVRKFIEDNLRARASKRTARA